MTFICTDENFGAPTGIHLPSQAAIGGCDPQSYEIKQLPSSEILMAIQGTKNPGGYPAIEAYWIRPILPNTGRLSLRFTITTDSNALESANVIETDTILVLPGPPNQSPKIDLSLQLNYSEGGQVQIVQGGKWLDVPAATFGKLAPGQETPYVIDYSFTQTSGAVTRVQIGDDVCVVPVRMQKADVVMCNWIPGAYMQAQLGLTPAAGDFAVLIGGQQYTWE